MKSPVANERQMNGPTLEEVGEGKTKSVGHPSDPKQTSANKLVTARNKKETGEALLVFSKPRIIKRSSQRPVLK